MWCIDPPDVHSSSVSDILLSMIDPSDHEVILLNPPDGTLRLYSVVHGNVIGVVDKDEDGQPIVKIGVLDLAAGLDRDDEQAVTDDVFLWCINHR